MRGPSINPRRFALQIIDTAMKADEKLSEAKWQLRSYDESGNKLHLEIAQGYVNKGESYIEDIRVAK